MNEHQHCESSNEEGADLGGASPSGYSSPPGRGRGRIEEGGEGDEEYDGDRASGARSSPFASPSAQSSQSPRRQQRFGIITAMSCYDEFTFFIQCIDCVCI